MATRLSSNTPFSPAQLTTWWPTATTAQVCATIEFARRCVQDGTLDDGQYEQIQQAVATYIATLAESYTLGAPTIIGAAGTTARGYRIVPTYALPNPYGPGAGVPPYPVGPSTPSGVPPFRMWAGPPAQGYAIVPPPLGASAIAGNQSMGRTRCYGQMQAIVAEATSNATLSTVNYVQLTMPAAKADFPDVTFDVLVSDTGTSPFFGFAYNCAPGSTVNDQGQTRTPYSMYDPASHAPGIVVRYFQPEVGVDATTTPHTKLYAINTSVAPWVETV